MKRISTLAGLVLTLALFNFAAAQSSRYSANTFNNSSAEAGLPYLQNFTFKDYDAHPQNWGIVQDERGVMYFANTEGLLEFDGVTWRLIRPLQNVTVVSLAMDSSGFLFAGGVNDFGYFPPGCRNPQHFVSL